VKSIFARAVTESRLGVPLERTLQEAAERLQLEEFDWAVMAIQVQRQVGGSLAEVLRTVAATVRDRARLKRQVRVLSAEGRVSAVILVALPLFMATFFMLFKRDYLRPLYTSHGGDVAIALGIIMIIIGWLWMRKLVKVDA
jgi:tight adherence protein B